MIITICGSMQFYQEMGQIQCLLEDRGFTVFVPKDFYVLAQNESMLANDEERINVKI